MRSLMLFLFMIIPIIGCKTLKNNSKYGHTIEVLAIIENDTLKSESNILLVDSLTTYKLEIRDGYLTMPTTLKGQTISLSNNIDTFQLVFENISINHIYYGQNMSWEFIIDIPPIDDLYFKGDTMLKYVYYLSFNPQEKGEGFEYIRAKY